MRGFREGDKVYLFRPGLAESEGKALGTVTFDHGDLLGVTAEPAQWLIALDSGRLAGKPAEFVRMILDRVPHSPLYRDAYLGIDFAVVPESEA